jgi:U32 family peptidase
MEKCLIAFAYGADAVYVGGKQYSLRASARNLNREELATVCHLARKLHKKVYITINIYARDSDLQKLPDFLQYVQDIRADAIIVSDPGVLLLAKRWAPDVPVHLSTQANTTNCLSLDFWSQQGVRRINVARELTYSEVVSMRRRCGVELELFVHGAMCVAYSGRCLLSALLNQRSANRGSCTQPCRWSYRLVEEKRPGQYFPIAEDSRGTYIFNANDLCLIDELGALMQLGIHAFKIEGRMKSALYLASVVRSYRQAIDRYWRSPETYRVHHEWSEDVMRVSHRPYTKGFLFRDLDDHGQQVARSTSYLQTHTLAGIVRQLPEVYSPLHQEISQGNRACLEVRSRLTPGANLDFLHPDGSTAAYSLSHLLDLQGNPVQIAHPNSWILIQVPFEVFPLQVVAMRLPEVQL